MLDRKELVTAALLGTDRRPLPPELGTTGEADPTVVLLDWAARSTAAERAGAVLPRPARGPTGPAQTLTVVPPAARDLIGRLLLRPQPELINLWLRCAVRRGFGLAPQHWALMAGVAARNAEISRPLLGAVLGERGRWFLQQNPQWVRLAPTATAPPAGELGPEERRPGQPIPGEARPGEAGGPGPIVDEETVRADPEAIFHAPQPWPAGLVVAALAAIGLWQLRSRTTAYAVAVGVRLPEEHYHLVQSAADYYHDNLRPGPGMILVREAFAALDGAVQTAREIDQAFSTSPAVFDPQESP